MNIGLFFIFGVVLASTAAVEETRVCYECFASKGTGNPCTDPTDHEKLKGLSKPCTAPNTEFACLKLENDDMIRRQCSDSETVKNACQKYVGNDASGTWKSCSSCTTERCNGASSLSVSLGFLATTSLYLLVKQYL